MEGGAVQRMVQPGSKFRPGRAFAEPKVKVPGLRWTREKQSQCNMYWMPEFVWCLQDDNWARCWIRQILYGAGLGSGLALGEIFASLFLSTAEPSVRVKVKMSPC